MEYKVGDIIGRRYGFDHQVKAVLKGGFGVVYICSGALGMVAVKSFKDEYSKQEEVIKDFYHEAEVWVKLGGHRNLVTAFFVMPLDFKPHVFVEYVDGGSLRNRIMDGRLSIQEALSFAIQFCEGMTYANSKDLGGGERGIVHRDIKPENIMLTKDDVVKITDFGLVKALGRPSSENPAGTPEYMSPEQFQTMDIDQRSDIYSFGVVLYKMLTRRLPFPQPEDPHQRWEHYRHHHTKTRPSSPRQLNPHVSERLEFVVMNCLEKHPANRYQNFDALRGELAEIYQSQFGCIPEVKSIEEAEFEAEISKKRGYYAAMRLTFEGNSLTELGKPAEAIPYFNKAIELDPQLVWAWCSKGLALEILDRLKESTECYDRALNIDPRHYTSLVGKGQVLKKLGNYSEALRFFDKAINLNPKGISAWYEKGTLLNELGKHEEALKCCDKMIDIDQRNAHAWCFKGEVLGNMSRFQEAVKCYDRALQIDPKNASTWYFKGVALYVLGKFGEAIGCFDRALEIEPRYAPAWVYKGKSLLAMEKYENALRCYDMALQIDPNEIEAWIYRWNSLFGMSRFREALECSERALQIDPRRGEAWHRKVITLGVLRRLNEALECVNRWLEIEPGSREARKLKEMVLRQLRNR